MGPWGHAAVSCNAGPCNMQVIGSSVINLLIFFSNHSSMCMYSSA